MFQVLPVVFETEVAAKSLHRDVQDGLPTPFDRGPFLRFWARVYLQDKDDYNSFAIEVGLDDINDVGELYGAYDYCDYGDEEPSLRPYLHEDSDAAWYKIKYLISEQTMQIKVDGVVIATCPLSDTTTGTLADIRHLPEPLTDFDEFLKDYFEGEGIERDLAPMAHIAFE